MQSRGNGLWSNFLVASLSTNIIISYDWPVSERFFSNRSFDWIMQDKFAIILNCVLNFNYSSKKKGRFGIVGNTVLTLSAEMTSEVVQESEGKSFATRLCELPVAVAAIQQLSQIYTSVKERNAVTRYACSAGESTINMANSATQPILTAANSLPLAQPILGKIECAGTY